MSYALRMARLTKLCFGSLVSGLVREPVKSATSSRQERCKLKLSSVRQTISTLPIN